jgi:hypothetical protein
MDSLSAALRASAARSAECLIELAPHLCAKRQRFHCEQSVECFKVQFGTLKLRPSVFSMVARVGTPDRIGGQSALYLEPRKSFEGRGGEYAAKIPDHCLDHHFPPMPILIRDG